MADVKEGFVSLRSMKQKALSPADARAEIRHIYFNTTRRTIEHDVDRAIELLKGLPTEEEREKATVYMDGLALLRTEWAGRKTTPKGENAAHGKRRSSRR
jgi:hypothetical protein